MTYYFALLRYNLLKVSAAFLIFPFGNNGNWELLAGSFIHICFLQLPAGDCKQSDQGQEKIPGKPAD